MKSERVGAWHGLVLAGLWVWMVAITRVFGEDTPVFQVRLTTREIEPTSRFEVVFEKPMVAADQIGVPDVMSPLRIDPSMPGDFVWRSRRVGVFQPKEPLRLGTLYLFQPRPGLRDAEGKPIASRLRREIRTPELSLQIDTGERFRSGGLGAMPAVLVSANAALNPQDLAARCVFQDGTSRIQARVEPVEFEDWEKTHPGFEMPALTWVDRFRQIQGKSTTNQLKRESGAAFWVRPAAPLVSESPWALRVGRGVRSADGRTRLASDVEAQLGVSLPFALAARKTDSTVDGGRQIRLEFSRPLAESLRTNWNQWIGLSPEVADVRGTVSGNVLSLRGSFQLNQKYDVEVAAGIRSKDGVPFSSDHSETNVLQFEPMPPRVWLPGYSEVQLLAGHRDFEVRSLNTPSIRLRVKALSRAGLIPALAGYERMQSAAWDPNRKPAPLEYAALAGRTVLETNLVVQERVDEVVRMPMGWDALIGAGRPGAFFVEVETPKGAPAGASGPQTLVQLTDLGFVAKSGAERTWVWVVSQKTSQPLKGVTVSLCDSEDGTLASGVTDERGLVVLPKQEAARWWVLELGSDIHVAPFGDGRVSTWGQGLPPEVHWGSGPLAIWSFTDREAYRPGDRIHLHGQIRRWDGRDWQLPQVGSVELTVADPRGQVVLKTNLTVTALGSCDWQGVLPEGSRGSHDLTLVAGNALWTGSIEVREFQPPAFEVRVALPQEIAVGQPLSATVDARYLLGAPVTRGRLQWHAEAVDVGFEPEGWDDFLWPDPDRDTHSDQEAAQVHQTGTVVLTSADPVRIEANLPGHPTRPGPQVVRLTAEVTDPNQQTVSQVAERTRQASDFYLGFQWAGGRESVQVVGQPLAFHAVAAATDGTPWTNAVTVLATLRRIEWKTVVVERAGGKLAHEQRRELQDVGARSLKTSAVGKRGIAWRLTEGQAREEGLRVEQPGSYELSLEATDGSGRPVRTVVEFRAEGDGRLAWRWHNGSRLGIVPDRSTLAPGESARLLVEAPFSGTALVTVEREEVQEAFITRITGNAPSIEVPFPKPLAPNAMVGVFLMRGLEGNPHQHPMPEWRAGWVNFDIPDPDRRLAVEVGLGASPAQPGQEMSVTVSVRTAAGLPAAGAEVTLYAVDEGFLQLMGTQAPDPVAFWGTARPLQVSTTQSFRSLLEEDPELLEFSNKGEIGGGGGRRGLSQRRRFIPCPLWEGSRVADEQGRVTSKFTVPDSLTRYRVVAVATHGVRRFGSSSSSFEVRKPLMVESGLPRFIHVGDRLQAQALVLNGTTNDIEARVSLQVPSTGISLEGGEASRVVRIPSGSSVPVSFPIQATASSDAEWIWRAEAVETGAGGGAADEVVVRLPVTRGVPDLVTATWARAGRSGTNLLAAMDPAVLESPRGAVVRVATGPLGFAGASIDWLARYPYGCVEQTSSMLVPWIVALRYPGLVGQADPVEVRKRIAEGVRQLWAMQLGSGMLSSWPGGSDTADWGSVYAAWVLTRAAEAGVDVGSSRRERLLQALSEACRSRWVDQRDDDGSLASFVAMVLADSGRPDPSLNAVLLDKAEGLTPTSRAFLAWALALQDPADDSLRAKGSALLDPGAASSKRNRARSLEDYWDPARLPAVRLLAGQKLGVDAATAERDLVALISEARRGFWSTTQGNAWALWALASTTPVVPEAGVGGVLKEGGRDVPFQITAKNPVMRWQFPMEASAVAGGIQVRSGSDQTLLVQAQVTAEDRTDPTRAQAVDRGLGIQRTYQRLDEENSPGPLEGLRVGDRVLVTLRVDVPEELDWLAIEDPIPSVLEPIQGAFRTSGGASHPLIPPWSSDFQEIRGDRVRHFKDHVPDGVHWIRYVARVRSAGDVVAPPARAEAMYDPDRFGQSAGGRLQSAP